MTGRAATWELLLGLALGALLGWLGYRRRDLARSGAPGVVVILGFAFGLGGWVWGGLPLVALIGLDLVAHYRAADKRTSTGAAGETPGRDAAQILASFAWGALLCWFHWLVPGAGSFFFAFAGAVATATADTWATELGLLSTRWPRLITTGRRVPPGTPGGVSTLGTVAAVAGAWLIGFLALGLAVTRAWLSRLPWGGALLWLPLLATAGGMAGCFVDSLLGATAQGYYYCERCEQYSEERIHACGQPARQVRGWSWLTDNGVNLVSVIVGAALAGALGVWLAQTQTWW